MSDLRIMQHMPLVRSIARGYIGKMRGVFTWEDLLSEGMEALWRCTTKWRDDMNVTFGLFAEKVIRNAYGQLLIQARRLKRQTHMLLTSLSVVNEDGEEDFYDLQSTAPGPLSRLVSKRAVEEFTVAVEELNPRDQEVVRLRVEGWTMDEIGNAMGVSRERVRQLQVRAVKTLRKHENLLAS